MNPEDEYFAARARLTAAQAAYATAESELIRAQRDTARLYGVLSVYRLSNDYLKGLSVPSHDRVDP